MEECFRQSCHRETYSLSCLYLDLFFQKGYKVELDNLQNLGLCSYILSSKVVEGKSPQISFETFNRDLLLEMEMMILQKLNFHLHPRTWVSILDEVLLSWNKFIEDKIDFNHPYFIPDAN